VEVLSPTNAGTDMEVKRHAYARAGVPEYWVVRPAPRDVIIYTEPDSATGDYLQSVHFESGSTMVSPTLPVRAPVDALFADAPSTLL
jgi:Uma2 family endonuclease